MNYKIVADCLLSRLETDVNELINSGYKIHGDLQVIPGGLGMTTYIQACVKL